MRVHGVRIMVSLLLRDVPTAQLGAGAVSSWFYLAFWVNYLESSWLVRFRFVQYPNSQTDKYHRIPQSLILFLEVSQHSCSLVLLSLDSVCCLIFASHDEIGSSWLQLCHSASETCWSQASSRIFSMASTIRIKVYRVCLTPSQLCSAPLVSPYFFCSSWEHWCHAFQSWYPVSSLSCSICCYLKS